MACTLRSFACVVIGTLVCLGCSGDGAPPGSSPQPSKSAPPTACRGANPGSAGSPSSRPGDPGEPGDQAGSGAEPLTGATDFSSADPGTSARGVPGRGLASGPNAQDSGAMPPTAAPTAPGAGANAARTVERGDIFKVLGDGRILNLNGYRGLQIIDVRDVDAPRLEGRYAVAGTPLEMYVVGSRAIVLLNNWRGYYGSREDVKVEAVEGGVILNVDIADRTQPKLLSQAVMPGSISTSRLTQGGGQAALYVAANVHTKEPPYTNTTKVQSFDVSGDAITPKSELDLGGYVSDVQATSTDLLLVASQDYARNQPASTVSVIDISRPDGTMVRGGTVSTRGIVSNKFNMDAYNGVLRIVSGSTWNGTNENHLETFSLTDLQAPQLLDHCTFGGGQMLYATIFIENKGFFVTYFRQDPFHAFSIDDEGQCQEHAEFIVSGWNDFLRPTLGGTRLVGIGTNDANSRRAVSVSLYDTTDLANPTPLLARSDLTLDGSYSEAQWDDRAFSVIEDAVDVVAANETRETGLILVPFQGYDSAAREYRAQVQILTFSDRTLTRRGVMDHGTAVRRSFLAEPNIAANLSEEELRLFDIANPNTPQSRGRIDVAPNYRQVFVFGDYVARVLDPGYYFGWAGNPNVTPPAAQVEVVPRDADLDAAAPVATIPVSSRANLLRVGELLVSVETRVDPSSIDQEPEQKTDVPREPRYVSTIEVLDLSDPTRPTRRGSLETDRIRPSYSYGGYPPFLPGGGVARPAIDCWGPCQPWGGDSSGYVVGDAVAFLRTEPQRKSVGWVERCYEYALNTGCERVTPDGSGECASYISGQRMCVTPRGGEEYCSGEFYQCNASECTPITEDVPLQRTCSEQEEYRYWQAYAFEPLDLRDPDQPKFADTIRMELAEEGTSVLAVGSALYFNFQTPHEITNDPRAHVKRYFRRIELADPLNAEVGAAINIPGDVIAADGSTIFTRDLVWEEDATRTLVGRLVVQDDLAYLQASRVFSQRSVSAVKLDGKGHMLVSHAPAYVHLRPAISSDQEQTHELSILDNSTLEIAGETDVDSWATFVDAIGGRALFSVSGGLLVFDVEDPARPAARAYFPTTTWPNDIYFDGKEAIFAGGPYGVYRFDTDVFNLLTK